MGHPCLATHLWFVECRQVGKCCVILNKHDKWIPVNLSPDFPRKATGDQLRINTPKLEIPLIYCEGLVNGLKPAEVRGAPLLI